MSLVYHERPGVYSSYDASSVIGRGTTERVIALVGKAEAKAGLYRLHSYSEAKEAFGEASELGRMAKIAYQNGAGTVLASPVAADALADYQAAFALIFAEKEASFCVAASSLETVQKALRDAVEAASAQNAECIGLVGLSTPSVKDLTDRAAVLNSERMVLVAPDVYVWGETEAAGGFMAASALAGVLTDQSDPALPLNGQVLYGVTGVSAGYRRRDSARVLGRQSQRDARHYDENEDRPDAGCDVPRAGDDSDCGRCDSGHPKKPAGEVYTGEKQCADEKCHPQSGDRGARRPHRARDHRGV